MFQDCTVLHVVGSIMRSPAEPDLYTPNADAKFKDRPPVEHQRLIRSKTGHSSSLSISTASPTVAVASLANALAVWLTMTSLVVLSKLSTPRLTLEASRAGSTVW